MNKKNRFSFIIIIIVLFLAAANLSAAGTKFVPLEKIKIEQTGDSNKVHYPCLHPNPVDRIKLPLERESKWSLPKKALADDFLDTINVLVLRYDFQYETVDDPNTTGRGRMNTAVMDSASVVDSCGHFIDPPPHNADYFSSHLRALKEYYEIVSDGKITLEWDVWPLDPDSAYDLPYPMSHYGKCDFNEVIGGLEDYFRDCIRLADTTDPFIQFSQYQSVFLFHAGSDRQNDIGFPETCNDLFTGFISYYNDDTVYVDSGNTIVRSALIMPETASQDNRATALNAVMAHEFGHQLGLVDLYSTATFMSQLGDFALMDNNGFGTGIDFNFPVGRVFGAVPLYPMAWSRAYLGFVDVVDFRQGSDIELVAAEIVSEGIKVARVPISDKEYYLLENRLVEVDGLSTGAQVDSATNVILGPAYVDPVSGDITRSREYDFLMPGSGVLIYHVDERVAGEDYNYDGDNNFDDNQLQWVWDVYGSPTQRFITLVEADGFVNFGGYYRAGYGSEEDMYRDDRNNELTPNSNPPAIDNTGNNTHINITNIRRKIDSSGLIPEILDSVILFDVETDKLADNFPVRAGYPSFGISPIAADLNSDGQDEIIITSGNLLSVVTTDGENFLQQVDPCISCPDYLDSSYASIHPGREYPVPLFVELLGEAITNPVVGTFPDDPNDSLPLVAIGTDGNFGAVFFYRAEDLEPNGSADQEFYMSVPGYPLTMSFTDTSGLYVLTDRGSVVYRDAIFGSNQEVPFMDDEETTEYQGMCTIEEGAIVMAGDDLNTSLYYIDRNALIDSVSLGEHYTLGPIAVDMDLDGMDEVVAATEEGDVIIVKFNPFVDSNNFESSIMRPTGFIFKGNPIAGDVDLDGQPDIIIGGQNALFAFNGELILKSDFPKELNNEFPTDLPSAAPIMADIDMRGKVEVAIPTANGNIYALSDEMANGFPLSGGEQGIGSPVYLTDSSGGKFGYLGLDGWFYLWHVNEDEDYQFWTMAGASKNGSFNFDESKLSGSQSVSSGFAEERFYNYPNPATDGITTIRYYLLSQAQSVEFKIYDFSGELIDSFSGPTTGTTDNEITWDCSSVTPGIYRCMIEVKLDNSTESAFTDIAVIR